MNHNIYKPDKSLLDTTELTEDDVLRVLVGWMKLEGTEDDEEAVAHEIVPFGPKMVEKTYKQTKVNDNTSMHELLL